MRKDGEVEETRILFLQVERQQRQASVALTASGASGMTRDLLLVWTYLGISEGLGQAQLSWLRLMHISAVPRSRLCV